MTAHRRSSVSFWCLFIFNVTHYNRTTGGQCFLYGNSCSQAVIWKGQSHQGTYAMPRMKASDEVLDCHLLRQRELLTSTSKAFSLPGASSSHDNAGGCRVGSQARELEEGAYSRNWAFAPRGRKTSGEKKGGEREVAEIPSPSQRPGLEIKTPFQLPPAYPSSFSHL